METCLTSASAVPSLDSRPAQQYVPTCPFCGGLLVQLSNLCRCMQCLFEICDGCGRAESEE
jgi:hypothetical protein